VLEFRVLRDRFEPTSEVAGKWKILHNEIFMVYRPALLYTVYCWNDQK
jgi:hypothetical protein